MFVANPKAADARVAYQLYTTRYRQNLLKTIPDGNYIVERSLFSFLNNQDGGSLVVVRGNVARLIDHLKL